MNIICRLFGRCCHNDRRIAYQKHHAQMEVDTLEPACDLRDFYDAALELLPIILVTKIIVRAKKKAMND